MKTYGSTTDTAHQIKNFYGAVDHKARLATKVYGPVLMPDAFTNVTIRSGGAGNITAVSSSATFTDGFKDEEHLNWERIVDGEIIPDYFAVERSGSSFLRKTYFYMYYHYAGSSAVNQYTMKSYSVSADSSMRSYLSNNYGITYKSSGLSNGTDYIDVDLAEATKTKLIHKGFAPADWGDVTYYSGTIYKKSLAPVGTVSGTMTIDYDKFNAFLVDNQIDTSKNVYFKGNSSIDVRRWTFYHSDNTAVGVYASKLASTTGITASGFTTTDCYFSFFDKTFPDTNSAVKTVRLKSGEEFDTLCTDVASAYDAENSFYTINGAQVVAGSVASFNFGCAIGSIGDKFLMNSPHLTTVGTTRWQVGEIGNDFLYGCTALTDGDIKISKHTVSIGNNFLRGCSSYNGAVVLAPAGSKLAEIGNYFMYGCTSYNHTINVPTGVTVISDHFLYNCQSLNSSVSLSSNATTIEDYFLAFCYSFNQSITIPSSVTTINASFMRQARSFNKNITIPATVTSIGGYFLSYLRDMTSTVTCNAAATVASTSAYTLCAYNNSSAAYTTGITLAGTYASDWHSKFSDRTASPYRKTIVSS